MKKILMALMVVAAMAVCGCERENGQGGDTRQRTPDITPFLGSYLMTRTTDLSISVMNFYTFPLNRDLDAEMVTVEADPNVQYGVIMRSDNGMYVKGTVDTLGLHLQNDTLSIHIDTLGIDAMVEVSMTHPLISAPENGLMSWTSAAAGRGTVTVPVLGELTATITGNMKYRTVASD